jgi:hypothetical protein
MYVCMYVCMYVRTYVCMHLSVCVCVCVSRDICQTSSYVRAYQNVLQNCHFWLHTLQNCRIVIIRLQTLWQLAHKRLRKTFTSGPETCDQAVTSGP